MSVWWWTSVISVSIKKDKKNIIDNYRLGLKFGTSSFVVQAIRWLKKVHSPSSILGRNYRPPAHTDEDDLRGRRFSAAMEANSEIPPVLGVRLAVIVLLGKQCLLDIATLTLVNNVNSPNGAYNVVKQTSHWLYLKLFKGFWLTGWCSNSVKSRFSAQFEIWYLIWWSRGSLPGLSGVRSAKRLNIGLSNRLRGAHLMRTKEIDFSNWYNHDKVRA